jgi:hypothetical protein
LAGASAEPSILALSKLPAYGPSTQKLNAILEKSFAPVSYAPTQAGAIDEMADRLMGKLNPVVKGLCDSTTEVYIAGNLKGTFNSRSIPSDQNRFATVQPGFYIAEHHLHQGRYDALQVVNASIDADGHVNMAQDVSSQRDLRSRAIPTEGVNPAHPNQSFATGINIHHAGIDDFTGVTRTGAGVSEGCQIVTTHEWDSFINIVAARTNGRYSVPYFNTWIVRSR